MSSPLQGGTMKRGGRNWRAALAGVALAVAIGVAVVLLAGGGRAAAQSAGRGGESTAPRGSPSVAPHGPPAAPPPPGILALNGPNAVALHLKPRPGAALLFDVDSGRVLWKLHPMRIRPIASVTKIMTALLVSERLPVNSTALITKDAVRYTGSRWACCRAASACASRRCSTDCCCRPATTRPWRWPIASRDRTASSRA